MKGRGITGEITNYWLLFIKFRLEWWWTWWERGGGGVVERTTMMISSKLIENILRFYNIGMWWNTFLEKIGNRLVLLSLFLLLFFLTIFTFKLLIYSLYVFLTPWGMVAGTVCVCVCVQPWENSKGNPHTTFLLSLDTVAILHWDSRLGRISNFKSRGIYIHCPVFIPVELIYVFLCF